MGGGGVEGKQRERVKQGEKKAVLKLLLIMFYFCVRDNYSISFGNLPQELHFYFYF